MMRAALGPKRSARGKTKHLVLPRPLRWQVGEASNPHAMRQPAIDGGLDEIGGKESERDCRPDQDLHDALTDIREDGRVPWHWIVDETRSLEDYTGYNSVKDGVLAQLERINIDPWRSHAPMILTESRSLAGVLRIITREYHCRIASTNGQCGGFLRTDIAPALAPGDMVLYFGDLDLSGGQIEDNTRRVLEQAIGGPLRWKRVALTQQQVSEYNLPRIIKHDRRYTDGRPHEAVETEALRQIVLMDILRSQLDELIPEPLARVQEREARQRRRILNSLA